MLNWTCGVFCYFQIQEEIEGCLDFLRSVYGTFGFTFDLKLSTRPEKFMGEIAVWDKAEKVKQQHAAYCVYAEGVLCISGVY